MSRIPSLMALIGLCGCPGRDDEDTTCPTLDTTVELGTGVDTFVPLSDGDPLPFERGPQGGYHVYGSLRATGVDVGDPNYPFELTNPHIWFNLEQDDAEMALLVDQPRALTALDDLGHYGVRGELVIFSGADPTLAVSAGPMLIAWEVSPSMRTMIRSPATRVVPASRFESASP